MVTLLASCTDDYTDWADLKVNEPEAAKTVAIAASSNLSVDFADAELPDVLELAQVTVEAEDGVDYTAEYTAQVVNEDGTITANLPVTVDEENPNVLFVASQDLLNAVKSVYGAKGEPTNVLVNVIANVKIDGEAFIRTAQTGITASIPKPEFEWEYIFGIGNGTGWSRVCPLWSPDMDGVYKGYIYIDGEFKFRSHEDSWEAPDWGGGAAEGTLQEGGNVKDPVETGYYAITVDLGMMRYELGTKITTIGVIGGFSDNSWGSDVAKLEYNPATGAWEGECEIPAGVEFKFRANDDWAINWGGAIDDLTQDGGNLTVAESGMYHIQLFAFCDHKAHVVLTAIPLP